jgi:hypothetical protein
VPTAIRTSGAVHVLLYFASQDLKWLVCIVVRGEVPAKGTILLQLRGSQQKNFSQIADHALRISVGSCVSNPRATLGPAHQKGMVFALETQQGAPMGRAH